MDRKPLRLLVVLPSWVGDVVMATPALRLLRASLPGSLIGGLMRPGLDELLAGSNLIDQFHVDRARGVMGPKLVAAKLRPLRYDTALLLTNSFSTALITRLAFIPERIGYDRDARGLLLTHSIRPIMQPDRSGAAVGPIANLLTARKFAPVSAVDYYLRAARVLLSGDRSDDAGVHAITNEPAPRLELGITDAQDADTRRVLTESGLRGGDRYAVLNPGANNPAKRWPVERFIELGARLHADHALHVMISGSPGERELVEAAADGITAQTGSSNASSALTRHGLTIGSLKGVIRDAAVMVTNDTGPRHIAAALGVPTVALFGPTDPRWTTLPAATHPCRNIVADPTLPPEEVADDHPERCRIDRIAPETVLDTVRELI